MNSIKRQKPFCSHVYHYIAKFGLFSLFSQAKVLGFMQLLTNMDEQTISNDVNQSLRLSVVYVIEHMFINIYVLYEHSFKVHLIQPSLWHTEELLQ